jgi:hypothetical protein
MREEVPGRKAAGVAEITELDMIQLRSEWEYNVAYSTVRMDTTMNNV